MRTYRFHIVTADSTVKFTGVDMGGKATLVALNRADGYLVVRVEGGKYWSGLSMQSYAPTTLYTFKFDPSHFPAREDGVDYIVLDAEKVIETPIRTQPVDLRPRSKEQSA